MLKTLKGRLSLIYCFLVALIALIGTTAGINLYRLGNSIEGLMTANYNSIKVLNHMIQSIEQQDHAVLVYIRVNHRQGADLFREGQQGFLKSYHFESSNLTERGEAKMVDRLNSLYWQYVKTFDRLQELDNEQDATAALDVYHTTLRSQSSRLQALLYQLARLNERAMFTSKDRATQSAQRLLYIILASSFIAVCGGFIGARYLVNRSLGPIYRLTETIKMVKAGDINRKAPIVYRDEVGELASEFNNMTYRLQQYEQSTIGKLLAEKNRTLAIVKSLSDPVIVLDSSFRLLLLNDAGAAVFEVTEREALNRHFLEVIRNGELFDHIAGAYESGVESRQRVLAIGSREAENYFNVIVNVVKDETTAVNGMVVLFQNITQIKQLERIKSDFIATVSHEFKTPLTSIMMGVSLLAEEKMGTLNAQQSQTIASIREDGETLNKLVNDLLEIARMEAGQSLFKPQPCAIGTVIDTALKKFREPASQQQVSLTQAVDPELPIVYADVEKIHWVLNNLIGNALKYTKAGEAIEVTATYHHRKLCVAVQDSGEGIPEEYLDKVFEKFAQVKGYDLEIRGTGLGLAIAKEIVEAHGGEIWCDSRVNAGSTFTFTLPVNGGNDEKSIGG